MISNHTIDVEAERRGFEAEMRRQYGADCRLDRYSDGAYESMTWRNTFDGWLAAKRSMSAPASPVDDRNAASPAAPAGQHDAAGGGWISVDESLPEVEHLVMVYSPPTQYDHPGEANITFDCIDPNDDAASWLGHNEHYEHFCCVSKPEGSIGPSEKAPYTHWMPLPPPPAAQSSIAGSAAGGITNNESSTETP